MLDATPIPIRWIHALRHGMKRNRVLRAKNGELNKRAQAAEAELGRLNCENDCGAVARLKRALRDIAKRRGVESAEAERYMRETAEMAIERMEGI